MRISVHAVGRMKAGPERELASRYFNRFSKAGAGVGLEFAGVAETPESRAREAGARMREEAARLQSYIMPGAVLILLDERGKSVSSDRLATEIGEFRDNGQKALCLAIGGADGHDPALRNSAAKILSFGAATWPHQLVRIMLAEQLYRAATILSGHPYHRA